MRKRRRLGRRRRGIWKRGMVAALVGISLAGAALCFFVARGIPKGRTAGGGAEKPAALLLEYMACIERGEYGKMYAMLDVEASGGIGEEEFVKRNSAIYEGIEAENLEVEILGEDNDGDRDAGTVVVSYRTSLDTSAGSICFENEVEWLRGEVGWRLIWRDGLIFPALGAEDRVRVVEEPAQRGELLDRNGRILAGKGAGASVGMVPGKMAKDSQERKKDVAAVAELLEMTPEAVEQKLSASWVKDDYFVPLQTIPAVDELQLMTENPSEEALQNKERQDRLLEISGVSIQNVQVRAYPLKEAAAHLIGYVQNVTAEDLEKHAGEGYRVDSVIGRSGLEGLFEKELRGRDGCRIYIANAEGREKTELARRPVEHGQTIRLTIDAEVQKALYEEFREDKSCSVAMDPETGEVLALVSTPSYDTNAFIFGMSQEMWNGLNENPDRPLLNRFRQAWCPGSTWKPIVAAIGLDAGTLDPARDYGNEGLSWQKDASWGAYHVTTLHAYEPVILENALIYSDNIYFAKVALQIGSGNFVEALQGLGFGAELPFEISMTQSRYSNTEGIDTEIQLADSGYGQGELLVNPLHMACLYTAFYNEGNVVRPYLWEGQETSCWIADAFSRETANRVYEGLKKVINDSRGTGYGARREDVVLAGKTGTAEIKASQSDTSGTELGWFAVFTERDSEKRPILIVSMVEDVKGRGGSGYVLERDRNVLERWFGDV